MCVEIRARASAGWVIWLWSSRGLLGLCRGQRMGLNGGIDDDVACMYLIYISV